MGRRPTIGSRRAAHALGHRAEAWVEQRLVDGGAQVLARRWRARGGEVDLIVWRGQALRFVEVKARRGSEDEAWEAIGPDKRRRIAAAAQAFLDQHEIEADDIGFLVAVVDADQEPWGVTWLDDAFDAPGG